MCVRRFRAHSRITMLYVLVRTSRWAIWQRGCRYSRSGGWAQGPCRTPADPPGTNSGTHGAVCPAWSARWPCVAPARRQNRCSPTPQGSTHWPCNQHIYKEH